MSDYTGECNSCLYMTEPATGEHCSKCTHNYVNWYKPMTNGHKLRMMSDRDLAEFMTKDLCYMICDDQIDCDGKDCVKRFEAWLSSPVENQR